jgi:hypothetical protein
MNQLWRARFVEAATMLSLVGGGLLIVSDFVTLYEIKLGAAAIQQPTGGDQHAYAGAVIGAVIIASTLLARSTEAWPPAAAGVALALAMLVLGLAGDLPDATRSDLVRGARIAHADVAFGFWLEILASLAALAGAGALALMLADRAPPAGRRGRGRLTGGDRRPGTRV